jgi:2-polyprenyl-3-methyl-5-hydroxy-6-metoxy-1,4-benzoquinol methylase
MTENRESSENLAAYQAKYHWRNPLIRYANKRFFETIQTLLSDLPPSNILDAGCGEGVVLDRILNQGHSVLGLDIDLERLIEGKHLLDKTPLIQGSLHSLPLQSNSFDAVLSLEVLEHVSNPEAAIQELHRVTNDYLLVSVPNEPWWRIGNMIRFKYVSDFGNTPEHINHWTLRGFKNFIGGYFDILQVRTPMLWTFILARK